MTTRPATQHADDDTTGTCGEAFLGNAGEIISCDRPDTFHIVHEDSYTGTTAIPAPGGAFISNRRKKK